MNIAPMHMTELEAKYEKHTDRIKTLIAKVEVEEEKKLYDAQWEKLIKQRNPVMLELEKALKRGSGLTITTWQKIIVQLFGEKVFMGQNVIIK